MAIRKGSLENMVEAGWWKDRRVFVTGHTGFMGGWLCSYLLSKGAVVSGYALAANTTPSFHDTVSLSRRLHQSTIGDVRDKVALSRATSAADPEVIFHLAAQPLVFAAHAEPVGTFETNVMGTVNLMEAARNLPNLAAMLLVTTDKVYLNAGWHWPYREIDPLGGREPYSASKAASEHVITAYANTYFADLGIGALRVGNIFGGGDWAANRLVPDAMRCFADQKPLTLRRPTATRPWQHVLDPLPGYLALAEALASEPQKYAGGWNFGPDSADFQTVANVAKAAAQFWGDGATVQISEDATVFEEKILALDSTKARAELGWTPQLRLDAAIAATVKWYKAYAENEDMWALTNQQIADFETNGMSHGQSV